MAVTASGRERNAITPSLFFSDICKSCRIHAGMIVTRTSVAIVTPMTPKMYWARLPHVPGVVGSQYL